MRKRTKWLIGLLTTLFVVVLVGLLTIKHKQYQPSAAANQAAQTSTQLGSTTEFKGNAANPRVIFYPGALVEPQSYSLWAKQVAAAGYTVDIVRFPLDLAVLNVNAAQKVQGNQAYVIGGHSLGGTMAARYAHNHPKHLKGVFFLASYPEAKGTLKKTKVPVLSLTASRDGVLNRTNYRKAKKLLPPQTVYGVINGGNHAGFGSYGRQSGDRAATISNRQQQREVAERMIGWLSESV
ncbi:alpha/beta fold hydrolase [Lactiplantibacillus modestisalitolerans]|uniref:Alpha/beta fold hydrolase n=1 Tax=Lactiplantibacillus modestisalitolerans TaxID=1457219 RepID=A0ABV5WQL7_9LACO|nr:alpha/beta fold hydrolase [Lactiplantibacillus modestisalitolerans]